jgi:uncharacterized membrane protein
MKLLRDVDNAGREGGRVVVHLRSIVERIRASLFAIPMMWIAGGIGMSQLVTWIDGRVGPEDLPNFTDTTVDSARAILSAISSGTIGAASVVFSLTLVAIQMSSSVYSSRVLRSFLRDRFQQHMIGILLATFTYSLLVLREVRAPIESVQQGGEAYLPRLSVFIAVVFAIGAVLALLASISHTSQTLRSSAVTRQLVTELVGLIEETYPDRNDDDVDGPGPEASPENGGTDDPAEQGRSHVPTWVDPPEPGVVLTAVHRGWVQQISLRAIRDELDEGSAVRLDVSVGMYVYEGSPLLTVWPPPSTHGLETRMKALRGAFAVGEQRSLQQDVAFGFIMIEDIANRALSPGVNDPNTASAVIEQLGEPVLAALERRLHHLQLLVDGCRFTRSSVFSYSDVVVAAFNQIRHFSTDQPTVQLALVRTLVRVGDELIRRGRETIDGLAALRSMLALVEADLVGADTDPAGAAAHGLIDSTRWYPGDDPM